VSHDAPLPGAISGSTAPHHERWQGKACLGHSITRAALVQTIELPDAEANASRPHEQGNNAKRYVAALHRANFAARESRRMAASRFSALPRSSTVS
jgi:hypothetical protein